MVISRVVVSGCKEIGDGSEEFSPFAGKKDWDNTYVKMPKPKTSPPRGPRATCRWSFPESADCRNHINRRTHYSSGGWRAFSFCQSPLGKTSNTHAPPHTAHRRPS